MNYKDTLNLPKTDFPMKANLVQREPEFLKKWEEEHLYEQIQSSRKDAPPFILHDGPPYANGDVHIGTALNKILKDIVVKYKTMMGFRSPYVPGWDCHGLPIELKVQKKIEKEKKSLTQLQVRELCRNYAEKCVKTQREQFMRLGILGDWFHPYLTMDPEYEAEIVAAFYEMWKKGFIYRGLKPVYWCVSCRTALAAATAEAEYSDHKSPSVYVKFRVRSTEDQAKVLGLGEDAYVVIWTTTPWTLPANLAIALHPNFDYVFAKVGQETWIIAEALLSSVISRQTTPLSSKPEISRKIKGRELEGLETQHPFIERTSPIVLADYVTLDSGTGCVHTAPGHGLEDYMTGEKYNLQPKAYSPLDDAGRFIQDGKVPDWLVGQHVFKANAIVAEHLQRSGALLASEEVSHSYPHCWRCKSPVVFRAAEQWFISLDHQELRQKALNEIKKVQWVPAWGENRIAGMVKERPDWVVSRQRVWGVPIPMISCKGCGHAFEEKMQNIVELIRREGVDAWFQKTAGQLLGVSHCPKCNQTELKKEADILDVWFESGVSHRSVLRTRKELVFPAQVYLEGSDQHRGWFQSSLWTALATEGMASFGTVVTHGFLVDLDGKKISKSSSYEKPKNSDVFVGKYGADIMRLWVASENYQNDIPLSEEIFTRVGETYRSIRNAFRILLANLYDFDPAKDKVNFLDEKAHSNNWLALDIWMLAKLQNLIREVQEAYKTYEFHKVYHAINSFCAVELSALYIDITKDRMYCDKPDSRRRRATQTVMYEILSAIARMLAPILSFTTEEAWLFLHQNKSTSVHLQDMPSLEKWLYSSVVDTNKQIIDDFKLFSDHRIQVFNELEKHRQEKKIGKSIDARVILSVENQNTLERMQNYLEQLAEFFIVSQVEVESGPDQVKVLAPKGKKCARSWKWDETVGKDKDFPDITLRDAEAVRSKNRCPLII